MTAANPNPALVRLCDLVVGETGTFFARLTERKRQQTSAKKPFYTCRFQDHKRHVTTAIWEESRHFKECAESWKPGQYFKILATFSVHERYGPQIDIQKIRLVEDRDFGEGFNIAEFQAQSRFDVNAMFVELRELVSTQITDEPLRELTIGLLEQHAETLKKLPATVRNFYPFPGGWLEHVLNVSKNVVWLCDRYRSHYADLQPPLNKDIVVAAAVLHEIGSVHGIAVPEGFDELAEESTALRLLNHQTLSRDLVRDAARVQGNVNPELLRLLEHVLYTYLVLPAWGSLKLPHIPEVLLLHHADDLDAKLEMYTRNLMHDIADGDFTEADPVLKQPLFKARSL